MSRVKTVLALIAVVLVAIFAVQNSDPVVIRFIVWETTVSHALIIVGGVAIGVLIGLLVGLNSSFQASRVAKEMNKNQNELTKNMNDMDAENKRLAAEVEVLRKELESAKQVKVQADAVAPSDFNDSIDSMDI
ncbi:MAG: lipopolysaccharide assembly protein LapA domain-containing protein [Peptostreptococcaceae bacterium]|nr:lipopolysaccharide assembly protein LapA domain-containing protein [Peptostreptococcaceae bacterium]